MPSATAGGRGLELLTVLFDARRPLEVGAIARAMGTTRGAAYRLLRALEAPAFVVRDGDGRWCLPAGGVMTLSGTLLARLSLRAASRPVIERLAAATGETVTVNVLNREHRMRIDVVTGHLPGPPLPLPLGETLPLHTGASGRVILAFLARSAAETVVATAVARGEDKGLLRAQLARARRRGYLAAVGNRRPGLAALAVPVFGSCGVAGAVTVVGPAARWGPEAMERAAARVRIECAALSAALGSLATVD
jgi:DNA-binding IclR family transcriptional regulator